MNIFTNVRYRWAALGLPAALLLLMLAGHPAAAQDDPTLTPETTGGATVEPTMTPTFAPPGDIRFGVIESFEDPAAAARLGAAWTRARFQWADVQPDGPDDWEPPLDDEALTAELAAGREVVGLLIGIPTWARDRRGLPRGLSLPLDDPDNTWAVFVAHVVSRYAGRIDRWIIWNEPDIDDRDAPGHTWDGTVEEFVQLQRTAYLTAKSANPDATVHLGAFTYFWDPDYFARFLDEVAADPEASDHNYYFDVATAHLYFQPNAVYNILYAFRRVMDDHGLEQPIWLVETNAPPMNDPYWEVDNWTLAVTLNEQAAFIPQAIAAAFAAGAERVSVYKLKDTEGDRAANPEPFGLMRWDNSRRPAFDTYRVAIRLLGGVTAATRERWDAVAQIRLQQEGQSTTVLFARLPGAQKALVAATAKTAELVDMWGKRETIEAEGGTFVVELPGALCLQTIADYCMIGGTTYYLIQENDGPRPHADPLTEEAGDAQSGEDAPAAITSPTRPRPTATSTPLTTTPTAAPTATTTEAATAAPPTAMPAATDLPPHTPAPILDGGPVTNASSNNQGLVVLGLGIALGLGLAAWWLLNRHGAA
jgi:hypothetical protein